MDIKMVHARKTELEHHIADEFKRFARDTGHIIKKINHHDFVDEHKGQLIFDYEIKIETMNMQEILES